MNLNCMFFKHWGGVKHYFPLTQVNINTVSMLKEVQ